MPGWIDSHCHIQGEYAGQWDDPTDIVADARANGVAGLVCVGTDLESSVAAGDLVTELRGRIDGKNGASSEIGGSGRSGSESFSEADPGGSENLGGFSLWYTVGVHPHDAETWPDVQVDIERMIAESGKALPGTLVGIGECGLDYHYDAPSKDLQKRAFASQIDLANSYGLTLVIHARDAWDDVFGVLESEGMPERTIMHCFTGGPGELERAVSLGAYISFSGIVTFGNAEEVREAARQCPLDRLLVETDSPFLSPVPNRGKPNRPGWVALVGEHVGNLLGIGRDEMKRLTTSNTRAAFGLA
ncbi:MAG: TatD family hydrolase [Acidimicrobiales bacterium]